MDFSRQEYWSGVTISFSYDRFLSRKYHDLIRLFFFFFWPGHAAFGILVPQPGIESTLLALKMRRPNQWTARKIPHDEVFKRLAAVWKTECGRAGVVAVGASKKVLR